MEKKYHFLGISNVGSMGYGVRLLLVSRQPCYTCYIITAQHTTKKSDLIKTVTLVSSGTSPVVYLHAKDTKSGAERKNSALSFASRETLSHVPLLCGWCDGTNHSRAHYWLLYWLIPTHWSKWMWCFVDIYVHIICIFFLLYTVNYFSRFFFLTSRYLFLILGIKDPEEKKKKMMELFESLPKPNRLTIIYLLDHLRR